MARRIFFALPVSDVLKVAITEWKSKYAQLPVRWLKDKNLHITLVPPLYVEEARLAQILLRFLEFKQSGDVSDGPVGVLFGRVSFGPDPRNPRLIWAQGEKNERIAALAHELSRMFSHEEKQQFRIHLTLARFRQDQFRNFPMQILDEKVSWKEQLSSIVLMESHLHPKGAEYEILAKTAL